MIGIYAKISCELHFAHMEEKLGKLMLGVGHGRGFGVNSVDGKRNILNERHAYLSQHLAVLIDFR